jgi:hypothetical protein
MVKLSPGASHTDTASGTQSLWGTAMIESGQDRIVSPPCDSCCVAEIPEKDEISLASPPHRE